MLKWFADRLARTGREARKDERGFTLIELLVVVIIIGILMAIAVPTFLSQRDSAEAVAAKSQLRNAATAQSAHFADNGVYTSNETALKKFGFPVDGKPAVEIVTPASGTGESYCMKAGGFEIRDSKGTPKLGDCT